MYELFKNEFNFKSTLLYCFLGEAPVDRPRYRVVCTALGQPSDRPIVHRDERVSMHLGRSNVSAFYLARRSTDRSTDR